MNIRFLRIFIFLMCALAAGIADAHTLHVGNKSFELSQTKYTTPSLAFAVPNEATWYAPLTTQNLLITTLRLNINNQKYSLCTPPEIQNVPENCDCIFTDTENYTYDENGRLIGADENLYLQSTGTQYIDTEYIPTKKTTAVLDYRFLSLTPFHMEAQQIGCGATNNRNRFIFGIYQNNWHAAIGTQFNGLGNADLNRHVFVLDATTDMFLIDGVLIQNMNHDFVASNASFGLFCRLTPNVQYCNKSKGYRIQFYDNNALIRHFVPVPACMRIGDFVVPENGMWDIVEQKFYGNSGTGSFIYGKDE